MQKTSMTNRGFKLIKVPGDGYCGLYSILATLGIDYQFHQELRRLITDTMLDDIEILNLLAVNDKDDIRTQIYMYIKKKKQDHTWLSYNELNMFYKLTKLNIIIQIERHIKDNIKYEFKYIPEAETVYSNGYICLQLFTEEVGLQGHFDVLVEVIPDENNKRIINDVSNRLVTVLKEMKKTQM